MNEAPICKSCGHGVGTGERIMTTLSGPYHADKPECVVQAHLLAPQPQTLLGQPYSAPTKPRVPGEMVINHRALDPLRLRTAIDRFGAVSQRLSLERA